MERETRNKSANSTCYEDAEAAEGSSCQRDCEFGLQTSEGDEQGVPDDAHGASAPSTRSTDAGMGRRPGEDGSKVIRTRKQIRHSAQSETRTYAPWTTAWSFCPPECKSIPSSPSVLGSVACLSCFWARGKRGKGREGVTMVRTGRTTEGTQGVYGEAARPATRYGRAA